MSRYRKITTICCAAVFALGLAACGGGSSPTASDPSPTPYEMAVAAIAAAETPEAAQAAYDAVKDDVTAAQGDKLQDAVDARQAALATMARADDQKMALMTAAGMVDTSDLSTQDLVDAARTAIAGLRQAIADAADVDDTSMYESMLNDAVAAVDAAQGGIDTATRRMNQMTALSDASDALQAALTALSGSTPTQALLNAANNALDDLKMALADGADLTNDEKAPYQHEAGNAAPPIQMAQTAFDDAKDKVDRDKDTAMAALAAKLHNAIAAPNNTPGAGQRSAAYVTTAGTPTGASVGDIMVTNGIDSNNAAVVVALKEDEDATVAAQHGWEGMEFATKPNDDGMYEAVVYSHIGDPTEGKKFGKAGTAGGAGSDYQYTLNADGELDESTITTDTDYSEKVAFTGVTRTAGDETWKKKEGARSDEIMIPGSYHGVPGNYYCTPTVAANGCKATVAAMGFTFTTDGDVWVFVPTNGEVRIMSTPDGDYASYGWWIQKDADGNPTAASAFHAYKGADTPTVDLPEAGTAIYVGGAAGKYALSSSTGGTNDAGHFTARATLEAKFGVGNANTISGAIDQFRGDDGMARDWSVKLNETDITDAGAIDGLGGTGNDEKVGTVWTIGDNAAATAGEWSGDLRETGTDGVPAIATGTFHSTYGTAGAMVGAFGVNKQ